MIVEEREKSIASQTETIKLLEEEVQNVKQLSQNVAELEGEK